MFSVFMFVAGITSHQITHSTVACWADLVIKQQLKSKFLSPPQLGTPVFRLHLCIVTGSRVTSVLQSCGILWRPTAGGDNIHYTVRVCRGVVPGHHPHTEMESCLHSAAAQDPAHCSPASAVRSSEHFVICAVTVS